MRLLLLSLLISFNCEAQWKIEENSNEDAKELTYRLISKDTLQLQCRCKISRALFYNVFEPVKFEINSSSIKIPLHALDQRRYTAMVWANKNLVVFRLLKR